VNQRPPRFLTSSVGTKFVLGLTGLLLCGFLVTHLAGNMLLFLGPTAFNEYSHKLISNPLIYFAEIGLLLLFITHITWAVRMTLENNAARPVPYGYKNPAGHTSRKSLASSTMIYSGLLVFFFVVVHLKQFKYGPDYPAEGGTMRDLHRLVVELYKQPGLVAFYAVMMVVLGFHLWHAFASGLQSLGITHPKAGRLILLAGRLFAVVIAGGFLILPFWIHLHYAR